MITSLFGVVCLVAVVFFALTERVAAKISFFDSHAAIVVVGGVVGALLLAIDGNGIGNMLRSLLQLVPGMHQPNSTHVVEQTIEKMRNSWREDRRGEIIALSEEVPSKEVQTALECLLARMENREVTEKFTQIRTYYFKQFTPVIEGWEIVGKLAPSFGMVGTVTGMVQLFRNMSENTGNLGGAMAMALLATLYGITLGAALGGPMAARVQNQFNEKLANIELLEKTVLALLSDQGNNLAS